MFDNLRSISREWRTVRNDWHTYLTSCDVSARVARHDASPHPAYRQVVELTIRAIIEDPKSVGMGNHDKYVLVRQKALRHTVALAFAISNADALKEYCTQAAEKTVESLGEAVLAAPMEAIDKWLLMERFTEDMNRDQHVPDNIKDIVVSAKERLDLDDRVVKSGLTHLFARVRMAKSTDRMRIASSEST